MHEGVKVGAVLLAVGLAGAYVLNRPLASIALGVALVGFGLIVGITTGPRILKRW